MRTLFTLIVLSLLLTSCSSSYIHLEQNATADTLQYSELPQAVADRFLNSTLSTKEHKYCRVTDTTKITVNDCFVVSADATRHQSWKYGYYFRINGKKMYIDWNPRKNTPFVVDETYIYWSTLLNGKPEPTTPYYRIRWN